MEVMSGGDLELSIEQQFALRAVLALHFGLRSMPSVGGKALVDSMGPIVAQAITAILVGTKCPFGSPPSIIIGDFDSRLNAYQHCHHNPRHCWDNGRAIPCPL
jgi:hypothetical protein